MQLWPNIGVFLRERRAQLNLSLRITAAAVLSLALAQALGLHLPLWSLLTAMVVTQLSIGRSLKATLNYFAGTVGGALFGGTVAALIPHTHGAALLAVIALAVAPLALLAAINPVLSVAPITAAIVILIPTMTHATILASAVDRMLEVAVGGGVGLMVSFLLLPANAHDLVAGAAGELLEHMAHALNELLAGLTHRRDADALRGIQHGIGQSVDQLASLCSEAESERLARLASAPQTGPLRRTLLRLRHDLVMVGRAADAPLPDPLAASLAAPLARVDVTIANYLRSAGAALTSHRQAPSTDATDAALTGYAASLDELRKNRRTDQLSAEVLERLFTLSFAFEQMRENLRDLQRCVDEWAVVPRSRSRNVAMQSPG